MKKRALISVSDKSGIVDFAKQISKLGYEIISTGGTYAALKNAGLDVIGISDITKFPECLNGRVKTLHPAVHAGILAMRSNKEHMQQLDDLGINTIDMVVVNLYPFKETISKPGVELAEAIENIDIGGPTMLRSAAKNYQDVYVVVDPKDYQKVIEDIIENKNSIDLKFYLSYKVFQHTAVYDTLISTYMRQRLGIEFPDQITFAYDKAQDMRYGENPHQSASFYKDCLKYDGALASAEQFGGKELSYNNINDTNGALDLLREFSQPCVVAVKHANPCGVGVGKDLFEAYMRAYETDKVSIYGGIVATNCTVDEKTALEMAKIFLEIVIAKDFTPEALEVFKKKPNLRVLKLATINSPIKPFTYDMKKVVGGLLVQQYNNQLFDEADLKVVTKVQPTKEQMDDLRFAMKVVKHTKSNAIVVAKDCATTGIGSGQTSRIWACEQAIEHSEGRQQGGVLASDAFFPFPDCVEECHKAGIVAIIQPGGSKNDYMSIEKCNEYGIAMVFTGKRHFKH